MRIAGSNQKIDWEAAGLSSELLERDQALGESRDLKTVRNLYPREQCRRNGSESSKSRENADKYRLKRLVPERRWDDGDRELLWK
jgi:hypothetical protein